MTGELPVLPRFLGRAVLWRKMASVAVATKHCQEFIEHSSLGLSGTHGPNRFAAHSAQVPYL
jgi:hypothetical protein